jgi:hypothetical protein
MKQTNKKQTKNKTHVPMSCVIPSLVVGPNYADLCVGITLNLALVAAVFVVLAYLVHVAAVVTLDCGGVLLLLQLCLIRLLLFLLHCC